MKPWTLRVLEHPGEMASVEDLQHLVWPGSSLDIVPAHMLLAVVQNGGLLVGAYPTLPGDALQEPAQGTVEGEIPGIIQGDEPEHPLVGFVFGFPGMYETPDGPRPKHCSHMLGVHPDYRNQGLGFALKRAQWQLVRHQSLDCITWTYDPLLSPNAYLNIARLGAVCSTYKRDVYGSMRDELNAGLPSDRFQVDWWINTKRVERRLSKRPRLQLDLAHFLAAGSEIANPTHMDEQGFPHPNHPDLDALLSEQSRLSQDQALILFEIPSNFQSIRTDNPGLALEWRLHARDAFERFFAAGYLVTDFIFLPGSYPRSFYVLSHGESTF